MNSSLLLGSGVILLTGGLILSNLYWRRRTRNIRNGIGAAQEWEEIQATASLKLSNRGSELFDAAEIAGVQPEEVPAEVERLSNRVSEIEEELAEMREEWADSWWAALESTPVDIAKPHVLHIKLSEATSEEAKAFAREALTHNNEIAIITAHEDGSFAVGVGEAMAEEYPAASVARRVTEEAGRGGSSGSDRLAAGGGAGQEILSIAATAVRDEIQAEL